MIIRVNPARAGMIPGSPVARTRQVCKPRASGDDPVLIAFGGVGGRVNPARAGMIPVGVPREGCVERKPRASGDDPSARTELGWEAS